MTLAIDHKGRPPWGFWATLAWALGSFFAGLVVSLPVYLAVVGPNVSDSMNDGVSLSVMLLASMPVQIAVLVLAARLRGWTIADYFALVAPRGRRDLLVAVVCLVALDVALTLVQLASGRDLVSSFQIETYRSAKAAGWLAAMVFVMVILAPITEELTFRGFLFRGWVRPGREIPAIIGISVLFAAGHVQYDWFGMLQILCVGLVLAWFRWVSGSTALTIAMHMLVNLESVIETVIKVEYLS
jgi:hypothetical protein